MTYKILIVEDDQDIVKVLKMYLENVGLEVVWAKDGLQAWQMFQLDAAQLLIVDIMIPILSGFELIQQVRRISKVPIIVLSAKNLDSDKILGLDIGADDYITKPFNPLEVVARVKSQLRRNYNYVQEGLSAMQKKEVRVGDLILNLNQFTVQIHGVEIGLTPTEYRILSLLMQSPGRVFTKIQILEFTKGSNYLADENILMVHISKLREKIEADSKNPTYIKTIRGLGYKIEDIKKATPR